MTVDRIVFAVAGSLVLSSVLLGLTASPWFLAVAAFVGANMLQSAFTKFILRRAGVSDSDPIPTQTR